MTAPAPAGALSFTQGSPEWQGLRDRFLNDLFFASAVVLGYANRFALEEATHLLPCRFLERRTGIPEIDTAPMQLVLWPRETGKSTIATRAHAIQLACGNPNIAILIANEKAETAEAFLSDIKDQFEHNELLRALFPEVIPPDFKAVTWNNAEASLRRKVARPESTFETIGVGGTKTGKHYDVIICDDLISNEAMENARAGQWLIMDRVNRWTTRLRPLLSSSARPFPHIRFIGTRWWANDTYDFIEKTFGHEGAPRPYLLRMKLADGASAVRTIYRVGDLAVMKIAAIEGGQAVFPKIHPMEKLQRMRQENPEEFSCLPAGQKILTRTGPRAIELLGSGDEVWTKEGRFEPVEGVSVREYKGTLVKVWPYGQGEPVQVTANHKVWAEPARVVAGRWRAEGTFSWKRADTLKRGDLLAIPFDRSERIVQGIEADPDFWFLVGHFLGDGTVNKRGVVSHCFSHAETELAETIAATVRRLFKRKARIEQGPATLRITYMHPWARIFFARLRQTGAAQKWLPHEYETLPAALQKRCLDGYLSADGHTTAAGVVTGSSVCLPLLCQLQRFAARNAIVFCMSARQAPKCNIILGRTVRVQPYYPFNIYPYTRNKKHKVWIEDGVIYRRVRAIAHEPFAGLVFNCQVAEDRSYVAATNAVTYSNCLMMNDPTEASIRTFQDGWLRYWSHLDAQTLAFKHDNAQQGYTLLSELHKVLIIDPAFTASGDGARSALVVVGTDFGSGKRFLLDAVAVRMEPRDLVTEVLNVASRWGVRRFYVEAVAQQKGFIQFIQAEAGARGLPIAIEEVRPGGRNKHVRIEGLSVYFKSGQLYVHASQLDFLDEYRKYRPGARLCDLLDALAYAPEVWPALTAKVAQSGKSRSQSQLASYRQRLAAARA